MLSETFKQHAEAGPVMTYLIQLIIRLFPHKCVISGRLAVWEYLQIVSMFYFLTDSTCNRILAAASGY